jgi:hypothetical protein
VRYPVRKYIAALALAELPYAMTIVYMSTAFLERRGALILGIGVAGALSSLLATYWLRRAVPLGERRYMSRDQLPS